jgi:hypothetical protein
MKKYFLGALITTIVLFALAAGAQAATAGDVVVQIKQGFVAGGKALPAGPYTVHQDLSRQVLTLRGEEPGTSVLLLATTYQESLRERAQVQLTREGNLYYLSEVATQRGVYRVARPHFVQRTAKASDLDRMPPSGSK